MTARIDLDGKIAPGATLRGRVSWQRATAPAAATLSLRWTLCDAALPDVTETVQQLDVATLPAAASAGGPYRGAIAAQAGGPLTESDGRRFEILLPESPYSFAGRLAELSWSLELTVDDESITAPLTLSPTGQPIRLGDAPG